MKRISAIVLVSIVFPAGAQTSKNLPQSLPALVEALPGLVHSKQLQFGPFSDAAWAALQRNPDSARDAIPVLSKNLQDPDQDVQFYTISILQGLALRQDSAELLAPVSPQLANAISAGNQYTQAIALITVANLGKKAPDSLVAPVEQLLLSHPNSPRVTVASALALMATRPTDEVAQQDFLSALNDTARPADLRRELLSAAGRPDVGNMVITNIVQLVNTSEDALTRDAAIAAAIKIGPNAVTQVRDRLNQIMNDPSASPGSHRIAQQALNVGSAK